MVEQELRDLIKESLKKKSEDKSDKFAGLRYKTLKNVLDGAQKLAKVDNKCVSASYIISATKKELKQLNETLEFCKEDEVRKEELLYSVGIVEELLPKSVSDEDVKSFVLSNLTDNSNIGSVMKALKEKFGDSLDGRRASSIVKDILNSR